MEGGHFTPGQIIPTHLTLTFFVSDTSPPVQITSGIFHPWYNSPPVLCLGVNYTGGDLSERKMWGSNV